MHMTLTLVNRVTTNPIGYYNSVQSMRASRNGARTLTSDDAVNAHNSSSIANVPDKYFAFENQLQSSQQMTTTSHYDHEHPSASDCLGQATGSRRDTQNRL